MTSAFTRRGFQAASGALGATFALPRHVRAQSAPLKMRAATRTLDVNWHAATVYGLQNAAGGQGLVLDFGRRFGGDSRNDLNAETIIHWRGQIPSNAQGGVPRLPMPLLAPGEWRSYDFAPTPGTHWMHSHVPVQEMRLLGAPLVVRSAADLAADRQEMVMFLHDLSFKAAAEVPAEITGGAVRDMSGMDHGTPVPARDMGGMAGMDHGTVDGMEMVQPLDIELDLPAGSGAFPILALREGARERTAIVLATACAEVSRIDGLADPAAPAFDTALAQELSLQAANPLETRAAARAHMLISGGLRGLCAIRSMCRRWLCSQSPLMQARLRAGS